MGKRPEIRRKHPNIKLVRGEPVEPPEPKRWFKQLKAFLVRIENFLSQGSLHNGKNWE